MTDNHFSYKRSLDVAAVIATLGARHVSIPPLPLAERESRTIQPDPPNRGGLPTGLHQHEERTAALAP
jgi:hypothetical protein